MIKRLVACILVCMLFIGISSVALANEVTPCADLYFDSASAFLASNKLVVFDCVAYDIYDRIAITFVWLEQEMNGQWVFARTLPPPIYVATNTLAYGAEISYSSYIGHGTFRIGFTVNADGYTISRYSNSRTF